MSKQILARLLGVFLFSSGASAASTSPWQGFIPKGYALEKSVQGDLNGDKKSDAVLILHLQGGKGVSRALVVLTRTARGSYRRSAFGRGILTCSSQCGGDVYGSGPAPSFVNITRGVLVANLSLQSASEVRSYTLKLRWNARASRFALIGVDFTRINFTSGKEFRSSDNLLSGRRNTQTFVYNAATDLLNQQSSVWSRSRLPQQSLGQVYFESLRRTLERSEPV